MSVTVTVCKISPHRVFWDSALLHAGNKIIGILEVRDPSLRSLGLLYSRRVPEWTEGSDAAAGKDWRSAYERSLVPYPTRLPIRSYKQSRPQKQADDTV